MYLFIWAKKFIFFISNILMSDFIDFLKCEIKRFYMPSDFQNTESLLKKLIPFILFYFFHYHQLYQKKC